MFRWVKVFGILLISSIFLVACGNDNTTKIIGVTQFVEHPSLDEAYKGDGYFEDTEDKN